MTTLMPLASSDVSDLTRLHRACFPLDQVWSSRSFAELLADSGHLGWRVVRDGLTLGFILGRVIIDEAELLTLAVSPRYRRQGLGGQLVGAFVAGCREKGAVKIFLEVAENNDSAKALYVEAGFRLISRRNNYYPGGLAAHVLQLDLA